ECDGLAFLRQEVNKKSKIDDFRDQEPSVDDLIVTVVTMVGKLIIVSVFFASRRRHTRYPAHLHRCVRDCPSISLQSGLSRSVWSLHRGEPPCHEPEFWLAPIVA